MVEVRDDEASYEVGPATLRETRELAARSKAQARKFQVDSPELIFRQSDPEAIANMDVNPDEIPGYSELKHFVNTELSQLIGLSEEEIQMAMVESMELIESIFGYTVKFHEDYDVEANVGLAMEQVHNLGTILFHFLNDLGEEIMGSTSAETIYVLGADKRIKEIQAENDPEYRGHVYLPESHKVKDSPELKTVYLGSRIKRGTIGHEVAHEIDRRMGVYGTVRVEYVDGEEDPEVELGPKGSFLWFLKNKVVNQRVSLPQGADEQGYILSQSGVVLNENSRANLSTSEREVFADLLAAKVLGPLDEDFFATAYATAKPIEFVDSYGAADMALALEQYFDQVATSANSPEEFDYIKYHDEQKYDELDWPVMPVQGEEK